MDSAVKKLKQLEVVEFDWSIDHTHDIGIIAEELANIIPEAVWYKNGQIEGIRPLTMIAVLTKCVQELSKEVESLKEQINGRQ